MAEDVELGIKKVLVKLVNSNHLNPEEVKTLKTICKRNDDNVRIAFQTLISCCQKKHSAVRLNCVFIADILFTRSHIFRTLLLEDFETYVTLTLGTDPGNPLPPPESQKKKLRFESIKKIKEWHSKFGPGYQKLQLSFNVLKNVVDFDELCLVNDEDRLRRREKEAKLATIWNQRIEKIRTEFAEYQDDVNSWMRTSSNVLQLAPDNLDMYKEELSGNYNILIRNFLPKIQTWIETLTKAGHRTDHNLLSGSVDLKNKLVAEKLKFEKFQIIDKNELEISECEKNEKINPKSETSTSSSEDPTSWLSTIKKVTGNVDIKLNMDLKERTADVKSEILGASTSSEGVSVPKIRLEDLTEPDKMIVDPDKSRFWVSDNREGQEIFVGKPQKISEFIGESVPVTRSCRVKLPSGSLCPRMDRVKCPLHGVIVSRNDDGQATEDTTSTISTKSSKKLTSSRKRTRLKAADKFDESSRSRISKKIFSKSSAKRVARDQKNYDKIRTKKQVCGSI